MANVESLPFEAGSFDFICVYQNHFHWQHLEQGLRELKRVLQPAGTILIACEYSKVSYYLKELTDIENFRNYLQKLGLQLIQSQRKSGWILYELQEM